LWSTLALPAAFVVAVVVGSLVEDVQAVLAVALNGLVLAVPFAAVYARVARGDRAALVVVPLLVGVAVAFWVVFELALPH
jgi:hypothetical protein